MIWDSPIYRFRIPAGAEDDDSLKEIVFDVTGSAPNFREPGVRLEGVFDAILKDIKNDKTTSVLDFGAAKFRNSKYLLEHKKYTVRAVDFEKLINEPGQAHDVYDDLKKRFKLRFGEIVFPHDFISSTERFDLVLLINVLSVMPVPVERLLVLEQCYNKLKKDGYLLYYSMHGEEEYKKKCTEEKKIGDGYYIDRGKYKTFFREFEESEVDFMLHSCGFDLVNFFFNHKVFQLWFKDPPKD